MHWIPYRFLIGGYNNKSGWLYKKNNHFYFEVAPLHQRITTKKRKAYTAFIKNYQPQFIEEVPEKRVLELKQWLDEIEALLEKNKVLMEGHWNYSAWKRHFVGG
jgi:predicted transport protein